MTTPHDATLAQVRAADPAASTWVSANAGTGKTRVLTDRVARLLLRGTEPQKILCLTYTKAAAAEMQNRLFGRLGDWAMMPDTTLRQTLEELGEIDAAPTGDDLRVARTLFASALETPGGLKIQTIHSFCDALLRRFPLEAGVSPQFEVLEDRKARQLRGEILEDLADGTDIAAFDALAQFITSDDPDGLLSEVIRQRQELTRDVTPVAFGLTSDDTRHSVVEGVFGEWDEELLQTAIDLMQSSGRNDVRDAAKLTRALQCTDPFDRLEKLESALLFGGSAKAPFGAKVDSLPTKPLRDQNPDLLPDLNALMMRVEAARERRVSLLAYEKTRALYQFARAFLGQYDARKSATGLLDYEDLIQKAVGLLTNSSMAQWVLYRLDGGIDHILVDEAQDTSPAQWKLVAALAEEFTSGQGARHAGRTIFVVGDEKQSIYSFQGADPGAFGDMQTHFSNRLQRIGSRLERVDLLHSFRSAAPIVDLVDNVFDGAARDGLHGDIKHLAFDTGKPGRVDLWPFLQAEKIDEDLPWFVPGVASSPLNPQRLLARQIAGFLHDLLASRQAMPGQQDMRPVKAGDVLILVQSRSILFHALIKELKANDLPVAGSDRLRVDQELAVRDILSLLKFASTPEDDLSLAEALRSPLLGFGETDLFSIAYGRERSLWEALRGQSDKHQKALELLWDMLSNAGFLRPYELIDRILTLHGGRQHLLARLGSEAQDGIDELLSQALRYEQLEAPTLSGFLNWFDTGRVEIKREMDVSSDQIRVMTVHGAKGLEAPIVILPDTAERKNTNYQQTTVLENGLVSWKTETAQAPRAQILAENSRKSLLEQERMRLLYVALTRAENWLIICGADRQGKANKGWYDTIETGMKKTAAVTQEFPIGQGLCLKSPNWTSKPAPDPAQARDSEVVRPDWLTTDALTITKRERPLSPSDLGGEKALTGTGAAAEVDEEAAMRRGTHIHALLEQLCGVDSACWPDLARRVLPPDLVGEAEFVSLLGEVSTVLKSRHLEHVFAPGALVEVGVTADLPELESRRISGAIDRLIISEKHILAVDFKSNALVPERAIDVPLGLLRQMGAYLAALQQVYPAHVIEMAIVWTREARLMTLPHEIVRDALKSTTTS
jgi:ATP-dependent helicase/nuclease subunit A